MANPPGSPECFGEIWDPKATECAGGYDPGYVASNGSKVRPVCDFFQSCKIRTTLKQSSDALARQALIPPGQLIRPPAVPYGPVVPNRQYASTQQPPAQQPPQWAMQHPQFQMQPVQMVPMAHAMPQYLAAPEVWHQGESYWHPLVRSVGRGLGKALGHTIAHFFDSTPFLR